MAQSRLPEIMLIIYLLDQKEQEYMSFFFIQRYAFEDAIWKFRPDQYMCLMCLVIWKSGTVLQTMYECKMY